MKGWGKKQRFGEQRNKEHVIGEDAGRDGRDTVVVHMACVQEIVSHRSHSNDKENFEIAEIGEHGLVESRDGVFIDELGEGARKHKRKHEKASEELQLCQRCEPLEQIWRNGGDGVGADGHGRAIKGRAVKNSASFDRKAPGHSVR